MKIYKKNNSIIFEGEALTGMISDGEMGFAEKKNDQWSPIMIHWWGTHEDFEKKCKELDIKIVYNN